MDASSRIIWFFDHFNPYFQCVYGFVVLCCAAVCFWSVSLRFSVGVLLLGVGGFVAYVQATTFVISAFQEGQPFLPFVPYEVRKLCYLCARLLGPVQLILFPITVLLIAFQNMEHRKT